MRMQAETHVKICVSSSHPLFEGCGNDKARTVAGLPVIDLSNRMILEEDHKMQEIETTTPAAARGQSAQMVWDAILELHNAEKRINRQAISALTGLRPTIVDDHVERLRDAGKLARAGKGDLDRKSVV